MSHICSTQQYARWIPFGEFVQHVAREWMQALDSKQQTVLRLLFRKLAEWKSCDFVLNFSKTTKPIASEDAETLWTRKDLAGYLRCALRTVDQMTADGVIPVVKLSKRMVRYRPADVMQVLKQYTVKGLNG